MIALAPTPPLPDLSDEEAHLLHAFLCSGGSIPQLLQATKLHIADFLEWSTRPAVRAHLDLYEELLQTFARLSALAQLPCAHQALGRVAASDNLPEARRAAMALLTQRRGPTTRRPAAGTPSEDDPDQDSPDAAADRAPRPHKPRPSAPRARTEPAHHIANSGANTDSTSTREPHTSEAPTHDPHPNNHSAPSAPRDPDAAIDPTTNTNTAHRAPDATNPEHALPNPRAAPPHSDAA